MTNTGSLSHVLLQTCTRFFIHFVCYICGAVLFFIMPMIVFKQQEDWTHAEAIYYCFISLSTIGFGDFVAGKAELCFLFRTDVTPIESRNSMKKEVLWCR